MEDQNLSEQIGDAFDIAIKIGELVQHRTIGVGIIALQSSLKAISVSYTHLTLPTNREV